MVSVVKYNYTNVAYCENCGRIEFKLYAFRFEHETSKRFCATCAGYIKEKYNLKVGK